MACRASSMNGLSFKFSYMRRHRATPKLSFFLSFLFSFFLKFSSFSSSCVICCVHCSGSHVCFCLSVCLSDIVVACVGFELSWWTKICPWRGLFPLIALGSSFYIQKNDSWKRGEKKKKEKWEEEKNKDKGIKRSWVSGTPKPPIWYWYMAMHIWYG